MHKVTTLAVLVLSAALLPACGTPSRYDAATVARLKSQFKDHVVVVEAFAPKEGLADADGLVATTRAATRRYLQEKGIFRDVTLTPPARGEGLRVVAVEATLNDFRIVSGAARFWGGALAGSSYMIYDITLREGPGGKVIVNKVINSNNNPVAAAWVGGSSDRSLPDDMGGVIGEWIIQTLEGKAP